MESQISAIESRRETTSRNEHTALTGNVTVIDQLQNPHEKSQISSSTISHQYDVPDFFLYTTLNQNQTKDLRKAPSNREERRVLAGIFNLNAIKKSPSDKVSRLDQIILDFHVINYEYCVEHSFSNEQISTFLAILNFLLHTMVKKQLQPEVGMKILKDIMTRHSLQRPPMSIFIFSQEEISSIINFTLRTFFRHYSLYEYSFKPKVELVLMTLPKGGIPQDEAKRYSSAKGRAVIEDLGSLDIEQHPSTTMPDPMMNQDSKATKSTPIDTILPTTGKGAGGTMDLSQKSAVSVGEGEKDQTVDGESIDWKKVGKLYKPESAIEDIISGEMRRLKKASRIRIDCQKQELEDKLILKKK